MFCPDVRTDQEKAIVHPNDHGGLTFGPRGGNEGEISRYQLERRFLSMREYTWEVARQGQQGGGVATTATPPLPQSEHVATSQLFQRACAQGTAFRSGIARQLSEIDGYNSGRSTGTEGKEEGDEDRIEELSDEDEEQQQGQGDSSGEEEEENETEEERDARLDEEERENRSAVVWTQPGYACVEVRRKRTDEVTRGDDQRARIEEEVPEVSTSARNQRKRTIRNAVAFSKQPAKEDHIENMTPKTATAPKGPRKKAPALDT
jgi:hypothetical protein